MQTFMDELMRLPSFTSCLLVLISLFAANFSLNAKSTAPNPTPTNVATEIATLQQRLVRAETLLELQRQSNKDLADAEAQLQQVKVELAKLEAQLGNQEKVQTNHLQVFSEQFSGRVDDINNHMNWWLSCLTIFLFLAGFLTYRQSKQEARQAANEQMKNFIAEHRDRILEGIEKNLLLIFVFK